MQDVNKVKNKIKSWYLLHTPRNLIYFIVFIIYCALGHVATEEIFQRPKQIRNSVHGICNRQGSFVVNTVGIFLLHPRQLTQSPNNMELIKGST